MWENVYNDTTNTTGTGRYTWLEKAAGQNKQVPFESGAQTGPSVSRENRQIHSRPATGFAGGRTFRDARTKKHQKVTQPPAMRHKGIKVPSGSSLPALAAPPQRGRKGIPTPPRAGVCVTPRDPPAWESRPFLG